jgi:hypothetical protein
LVGALGVVDVVERVELGLQLGQVGGEWLFVEVAEQRLVEAFVLALGVGSGTCFEGIWNGLTKARHRRQDVHRRAYAEPSSIAPQRDPP